MPKSQQKYKLFPGLLPIVYGQRIKTFLVITIVLVLFSCENPRQKFYDFDIVIIEKLQHYFEQEELWAEAIKQMNRSRAIFHLDSMSEITNQLSGFVSPETLPAKDTLYLQGLNTLLEELETIVNQNYPEIMEIALVPEPGYTTYSQNDMMLHLKEMDSIIQQKLNNFYTIRGSMLEKYNIEILH